MRHADGVDAHFTQNLQLPLRGTDIECGADGAKIVYESNQTGLIGIVVDNGNASFHLINIAAPSRSQDFKTELDLPIVLFLLSKLHVEEDGKVETEVERIAGEIKAALTEPGSCPVVPMVFSTAEPETTTESKLGSIARKFEKVKRRLPFI